MNKQLLSAQTPKTLLTAIYKAIVFIRSKFSVLPFSLNMKYFTIDFSKNFDLALLR
eukprot:TRINITY_DN3236_c2_g1_i1.p1 TRINITY_DN3236_c2_g1~~TRINITY_DN3236_c2_g1_i1.p1  ORF type:complete len:56 (-),score=8.71 TRINITY_DN3236_c2_g1_i1:33-200(-)